jgi:peptidyl-tRNA hydrolase
LGIHDKNAKQTLYNWETFGCAKIVVRADNLQEMMEVKKKAEAAGINTHLI